MPRPFLRSRIACPLLLGIWLLLPASVPAHARQQDAAKTAVDPAATPVQAQQSAPLPATGTAAERDARGDGTSPHGTATEQQPLAPQPTRITVASINLLADRDDWPSRREAVLAALKSLQPDVVALQEVLQRPDLPNQACWLAGRLDYSCYFITADPPSHPQRRGNALLTRRSVIQDGVTLLHPLDVFSTAGMLQLDLDGTPVNIYVTQLHGGGATGEAARARQARDLLNWINATAGDAPSLLAGDLSAGSLDAGGLEQLRDRFKDAKPRTTDDSGSQPALTATTTDVPTAPDAAATPTTAATPMPRAAYQHLLFEPARFALVSVEPIADATSAIDGLQATLTVSPDATIQAPPPAP